MNFIFTAALISAIVGILAVALGAHISPQAEAQSVQLQQPSPSVLMSNTTMLDVIQNSTSSYNGNGSYPGNMVPRWSAIVAIDPGTIHIFNGVCQPNEYPTSALWLLGSGQLSVIGNYPSRATNGTLSWTIVVASTNSSTPLPAAGGVLCAPALSASQGSPVTNKPSATPQANPEPNNPPQTQQAQQSSQKELEQSDGGLTASLNDDSFNKGDPITVSGRVSEREPSSSVLIKVIDPQNKEVELKSVDVSADNRFTYSFDAGERQKFDIDEQMELEGNYRMVVSYLTPDLDLEEVEFVFAYSP